MLYSINLTLKPSTIKLRLFCLSYLELFPTKKIYSWSNLDLFSTSKVVCWSHLEFFTTYKICWWSHFELFKTNERSAVDLTLSSWQQTENLLLISLWALYNKRKVCCWSPLELFTTNAKSAVDLPLSSLQETKSLPLISPWAQHLQIGAVFPFPHQPARAWDIKQLLCAKLFIVMQYHYILTWFPNKKQA